MTVFLFLLFSMMLLSSFFRLKELFQVKNGFTMSLHFFFLKMPNIWVGPDDAKRRKNGEGLRWPKDKLE